MTKKNFITLWSRIEVICKKKVNGEYRIDAVCEMGPFPGSYRLVLKPRCIMWADELSAIAGLTGMLGLSIYFNFSSGSIELF